jgi:hypothetical protein
MDKEEADIRDIKKSVDETNITLRKVVDAFPHDNTTDKPMLKEHRSEHELSWNSKVSWDRRKEKAKEHIFVGAAWAVFLFVCFAIYEAAKLKIIS